MKKILLTGFGPFLDNKENPSQKICQIIERQFPEVSICVLPVDYQKAFESLRNQAEVLRPDFIIMMGLAAKRMLISLEKVAFNWNESEHPDDAGKIIFPEKINSQDDQLARMTTFPVNEIYKKLKQRQFPVELSFSAGTYVCNNLFYKTLTEFKEIPSLFVHLPSEEYVGLDIQTDVIKNILMYCLGSD